MPSGHASHKGHSVKPNTNAEGQLDIAADLEENPRASVDEGDGYPFDAERKEVKSEAMERSEKEQSQNK